MSRLFRLGSISALLLAAACAHEPAAPAPDPGVSITVELNGVTREVRGGYSELVGAYTGDRDRPFLADGEVTVDPARFLAARAITVETWGEPVALEGSGAAARTVGDYAGGVAFAWDEGAPSLHIVAPGQDLRLTLRGLDDAGLARRWLGGVMVDLVEGRSLSFVPSAAYNGAVVKLFGIIAKVGWKKILKVGGVVVGTGVLYTVVLNINIQQCRQQVVGECRTGAKAECGAAGQVVKNVKASCSISLLGTVEASCEFECRDKPPAKAAADTKQAQLSRDDGFALLALTATDPIDAPTEEPPVDDPGCVAELTTCTYADESDPGSCTTGPAACPEPWDGVCTWELCHNEYGDWECTSGTFDDEGTP